MEIYDITHQLGMINIVVERITKHFGSNDITKVKEAYLIDLLDFSRTLQQNVDILHDVIMKIQIDSDE
jgi:hypothetical protein